ncbi:unnamed protein product [Aureobasidium vineae]|uniref:Uncharacterized protein n=1 Tax=Aureobasidium vineae TaxID=2773715 RepID=A0A9N8PJ29_9PEZI|nr:unnamed protein product [Aureobasidium vineae]
MSQLSQHRQRVPSLGIIATSGRGQQATVFPARPSPLSSHPPTPVEVVGGTCNSSSEQHSNSGSTKHSRNVSASTSSLPFGSPSNLTLFPRKHPSNFSTPDLSKSASPSTDSLHRQDTNSFAGSSSQLHHLPLAYQLNSHDTSFKLDLASVEAMSHHDNHRHDSFGSQLPVPKGANNNNNNGRRRSISMQKLFSLSSLKSSFGNSRTSLVSTPSTQNPPQTASSDRPASDSTTSSRGVKRAAEEDYVVVKHGQDNLQPPLRKRKSNSWFRRKSALFTFNSHNSASAVADDYDMPQGPDAMVLDEPENVHPTTEHTQAIESDFSSDKAASVYTTQTTQYPPVLPPLSPMSKTQTQSSQYSQPSQTQRPERPASHRTFSSQSRISRSSSQHRTPYSPSAREAFSPPPTLPELTRIDTTFGDQDMGELFAQFGR